MRTNLETVNKIVNFSHKTFHKNDFRQANTHISQFRWKCLHFTEIVQLHGC